ncbi:MAG: hypothetical protein V4686_00545 [Patescibacteria group bacterium]
MCLITVPKAADIEQQARYRHDYQFGRPTGGHRLDVDKVAACSQPVPSVGLEFLSRPTMAALVKAEEKDIKEHLCHFDLLALRDQFDDLPMSFRQRLHTCELYAARGIALVGSTLVIPYITATNLKPFVGFASVLQILENRHILGRISPRREGTRMQSSHLHLVNSSRN